MVLEHQVGNYGGEQSTESTVENFTNDDLRIEDLVANIALETYSDEFKTVNDSEMLRTFIHFVFYSYI